MVKKIRSEAGYSLIELVLVLVIVGILAGVGLRSLTAVTQTSRFEETRQEMDRLAYAIAGNPSLTGGGARTDFGYVGDVGGLPANLDALASNPGGWATWKGPYITNEFHSGGVSTDFKIDAWGQAYTLTGGLTLGSTGGGTPLTRPVASSASQLLRNRVTTDRDRHRPYAAGYDVRRLAPVRLHDSQRIGRTGEPVATAQPGRDRDVRFDSDRRAYALAHLPADAGHVDPTRRGGAGQRQLSRHLPGRKPLDGELTMARVRKERGFSLIELLVVIVVIGILAGVAIQSMTATVKDLKRTKTEREMEMLSRAIVGDPSLTQNGHRSDFGYVGDVGAFPPNLQALYQNPGGLSTWNGPYIPISFAQDSTGFKTDEWGRAYNYTGGLTLTSTGGGTTFTKKIADAANDYLRNRVTGNLADAAGGTPGAVYDDSTNIIITFPNGAGGTNSKTYHPTAAGDFALDSIPVGTHSLRIVFTPDSDTLQRYVTVLPRNRSEVSYQFASTSFGGSAPPPSCDSAGTITLRPMGVGVTALSRSDGPANWRCVDEAAADNGSTYVYRYGSYATDAYAIEDVLSATCTITGVTVYARGYKTTLLFGGHLRTVLRIGSTNYQGAARNLGNSWTTYSDTWPTNPATGSAWTWADINSLQAGVSLESSSPIFASQCTQVYVVVAYAP